MYEYLGDHCKFEVLDAVVKHSIEIVASDSGNLHLGNISPLGTEPDGWCDRNRKHQCTLNNINRLQYAVRTTEWFILFRLRGVGLRFVFGEPVGMSKCCVKSTHTVYLVRFNNSPA